MPTIAFCAPKSWKIDSTSLLNNFKKLTPNNDGIWENLVGITDIYAADWIVVIEDFDLPIDLSRINQERLIFIRREPPWIANFDWSRWNTKHKYNHFSGNSYFLNGWSCSMTYKQMAKLSHTKRNKKVCTVISNKRMCPGHKARLAFVKEFCRRYPGTLDVYGVGMGNEGLGNDFKGATRYPDDKKHEWLSQYDYALAFENGQGKSYFSEKLIDPFMAYTMPIYWGAPNIMEFFPSESLYTANIQSSEEYERLYNLVSTPLTQQNIDAISIARSKIMDEYNWWPTLKKIISTGKLL